MQQGHEKSLKHFEMIQVVSNGLKLMPSEIILMTPKYPNHNLGAASGPEGGILLSLGYRHCFKWGECDTI